MSDLGNSIGALWARTSRKGAEFLSGKIDGIGDVVLFRNSSDNPKAPTWKIYKSEPGAEQRPSRVDRVEDDGF